jgi:hypothetical protein
MAEYKKEIGAAVAIAAIAALTAGILAITVFPNGLGTTSSATTGAAAGVVEGLGISPLAGELSGQDLSCSFASGVCTLTIVNNSTTPLQLETCDVQGIVSVNVITTTYAASTEATTTTYIALPNGTTATVVSTPNSSIAAASTVTQTVTESNIVNGTVGGPATAGIPADSQVTATCTVPTSQFAPQTVGSYAGGSFTVKLVNSADGSPAGTETRVSFQGTWSP